MDAAAELGMNPVSKHQIQPEYGDEQADAGRDCRTCLARPNSQARTGIGNLTRLILTLALCDDNIHCTCIYTRRVKINIGERSYCTLTFIAMWVHKNQNTVWRIGVAGPGLAHQHVPLK